MSTYTGYEAATVLALYDNIGCVQFRGNVPSGNSDPYDTHGKYILDENNLVFFNMTVDTLTVANLPRNANVYDPVSKTVMKNTAKGETVVVPPCKNKHWKRRFNDCVELSKTYEASGTLIFIIDMGPSDEAFDSTIKITLTQMSKSYIIVLQDENTDLFDDHCAKRKRADFSKDIFMEKFISFTPSESVIVEISPPFDTVRDITTYLNALLGAHKMNTTAAMLPIEHTLIIPNQFKLDDMSARLIDSSSVINGSLEIGTNTNSILFKIMPSKSEKTWTVTVVGLVNEGLPFTTQLVPYGSEMLKQIVNATKDETNLQLIFEMMQMSSTHRSAFESKSASDFQRLWNRVIENGSAKWFAARATHDNNTNIAIGVVNPPPFYARLASNAKC